MTETVITFRSLQLTDLPLLHRWLNRRYVAMWWGEDMPTYEEVVAKYQPRIFGQQPTRCFLTVLHPKAIGYIQSYRIHDYPDYHRYVNSNQTSAGVDLFIGEVDFLHRGLGSKILRRYLQDILFKKNEVECCIVGPEPENRVAIRAYEKAGFRHWKTIRLPDKQTPEYLMRIERSDVISERVGRFPF